MSTDMVIILDKTQHTNYDSALWYSAIKLDGGMNKPPEGVKRRTTSYINGKDRFY